MQQSLEIKFCPTCNNILNITKNPPKNKQISNNNPAMNLETPNTVSDYDSDGQSDNGKVNNKTVDNKTDVVDDSVKIEQVINKLANNKEVTENDFSDFKLEQFLKHKTYQKLDKKTKSVVQLKITTFLKKWKMQQVHITIAIFVHMQNQLSLVL